MAKVCVILWQSLCNFMAKFVLFYGKGLCNFMAKVCVISWQRFVYFYGKSLCCGLLKKLNNNNYCSVYTHGHGAQWLSGRVLDLTLRDHWFEPHQRHYFV